MKRILPVLMILLLCFSCSSDENMNCCTIIDVEVHLKYENHRENGESVSNNLDRYDLSEIDVFHRIDGTWEEYFEGNLDYPRGIRSVEGAKETQLTLFLSTKTNKDGISGTKLKYSNGDEDIFDALIDKSAGNMIVKKIWYENELRWSAENNKSAQVTIVK